MRKISLFMVLLGFFVLAAVPKAAIGLTIGSSFQNMAPGGRLSAKLMTGDFWEGILHDFDGGSVYDHFIRGLNDRYQSTRSFYWIDTADNFSSTMTDFRLIEGGFGHFGFGYPSLGGGDGFKFIRWGTNGRDSTPVPEPAAMLLLGSGLMGLSVLMRKKIIKIQ